MSLITTFLSFALCQVQAASRPEDPYEKQRNEMVDVQLKGRGVKDPRVLEAMRMVPRRDCHGARDVGHSCYVTVRAR